MENPNLKRFINIAKKYLNTEKINTVIELGARDCSETLEFYNLLHPQNIYTFECNPSTLPVCREKVKGIESIHLIEKAVYNKNGKVKFYPIDQQKTITTWQDGNPGASSLFKASGKYPVEKYVQKEIKVEGIRLESFLRENNIDEVDLLWMDIQGAELLALQGLGNKIHDVKFIYTEVEFFEIYKDQPLYKDIKSFLEKKGFMLLGFGSLGQYSGDAIFINKKLITKKTKFIKIKLLGDQELSWKGYRFTLLVRAINFVPGVYEKILFYVALFRDRLTWKKKLTNFQDQFRIEVNMGLKKYPSSEKRIDVIIPVAHKDIEVLPYCVKSIEEYIKHPINEIFIISSKTEDIKTFCSKNGCTFIDENKVLPISKKDIVYNVGLKDRSGWLFQQLLKLSGDTIASLENYLIVDADLVYIRPKVFDYYNKTIFDISDEYHQPYFKTYKKLLGSDIFLPASFISHNMLINIPVLKELKNGIKKRNDSKWYNTILKNIDKREFSCFSEWETYGNYFFQNYRDKMILEYWFNLSLKRAEISNIKNLVRTLSPFYKSLSFHSSYDK